MAQKIKILHLITTLDTGGAEMMLAKLLADLDGERFCNQVVSMTQKGPVGEQIKKLGIRVDHLGLLRGRPKIKSIFGLARMIREFQPDIILTWLYHADLLGLLTTRACSRAKVVWNIRCSHIDLAQYKKLTAVTVRLCSLLSHFPDAVIANSNAGRKFHQNMGYRPKHFKVIPNGFDLERFAPDARARRRVRAELGIGLKNPCVAMVARFDPMKDHKTFLRAAALIAEKEKHVHFILCGNGVDQNNASLYGMVRDMALSDRVHLLGPRDDVPAILAATDVFALCSKGEGFPNVVGEAMACGVPAVASDVGDVREIIGDTGLVVPSQNPSAMAGALCRILAMPAQKRKNLGKKARQRIQDNYSMKKIAARYEEFYFGLLSDKMEL